MMKAVTLAGIEDIQVIDLPAPRIQHSRDAIVQVSLSAICGADLLPYHGHTPGFEFGMIPGHEFVGIISELGESVTGLNVGDRVVNTSMTSDGTCLHCKAQRFTQCTSRSLFGYSGVYPRLDGGQAEFVRVPEASRTLMLLPETVSSESALFLADILPTGLIGVRNAQVSEGETIVVQGAGPVGLMAIMLGIHSGAKVIAIDGVPERRAKAEELGALVTEPVNALTLTQRLTKQMGADAVIEASGSIPALSIAFDLVRARGIISVIGAHFENDFSLNTGLMFEKELTLKFGIGNPCAHQVALLELIISGAINPGALLSHTLPVDEAADAYHRFDNKEYTKVALTYD